MKPLGKKKPKIDYPCDWEYKIIGSSVEEIVKTVEYAVDGAKYDLTPSNISNKGNYYSLKLIVKVENETKRNSIYKLLEANDTIKFVL